MSTKIEDLLADESFQQWFFRTDENAILDWEERVADDAECAARAQEAFAVLEYLSLQLPPEAVQQRLAALQERLRASPVRVTWYRRPAVWRVAAVLMLISAGWLWLFNNNEIAPENQPLAVIENPLPAAVSVCNLPDGTVVRLKTGSILRLDDAYNVKERRVFLVGEGYFEVAKDPEHPFSVVTGDVVTTALGTTFNVRAYPDEPQVKVVLIEGRVRVQKEHDGHAQRLKDLEPGKALVVEPTTLEYTEQVADPAATRWKDGWVLTFRDTPFAEMVKVLETYYQVQIVGYEGSALEQQRITAEFDRSTPISEVLGSLAFTLHLTYSVENKRIVIQYLN